MRSRAFLVGSLLLLLSPIARAQSYDLTIHLGDGQTITIPTDDIRRLEVALYASGVDDADGASQTPRVFQLLRAYPNPFNPSTTVEYEIPQSAQVCVRIFDLHGALVSELRSEVQPAGRHQVTWDGTDSGGARVASGIYFCAVKSGEQALSRQLLLVK